MRKIADGLLEFERYVDRKTRLQNASKRNETLQISDVMSANNELLLRGLSPVTAGGHDVLSGYDGLDQQEMMFSQQFRDNSSSMSPHSLRNKGNMST